MHTRSFSILLISKFSTLCGVSSEVLQQDNPVTLNYLSIKSRAISSFFNLLKHSSSEISELSIISWQGNSLPLESPSIEINLLKRSSSEPSELCIISSSLSFMHSDSKENE